MSTTPAPTGPNPAPAAPTAPAAPATTQAPTNNGGNPMKYVWPILAGIALVAAFILGWNWLQRQPTASPAVVPYGTGQQAPAGQPGQPLINNENIINIKIGSWDVLKGICNQIGPKRCPMDDAGRIFVLARVGDAECIRMCKPQPRTGKPNCFARNNTTAKPPTSTNNYYGDTYIVQQPGTGGSTSTGGSPVASISTGAISGMRDFSAGFGPMTAYAQAAAPRDTIAMGGSSTIGDTIAMGGSSDHSGDTIAMGGAGGSASNNQQTTVVEGDTYVEGDRIYIFNDSRVYNTYIFEGDTYVIPSTAGPIYIVVGGHLFPASDICSPGGVCEECAKRGDCPPWLNDRCVKECPVGPGPTATSVILPTATTGPGTSVPPTTPPTSGPGPSATPVPPTPVPGGKCYTKGWRIGDEPDNSPYVVTADDSGRIWQQCLDQEDRRFYKEHSITVPGDPKFGRGHWFFGEGTTLIDNSGKEVANGDFGACVTLMPGGFYKVKQQAGRKGGMDLWLRPECAGGAPLPTQTPIPQATPNPGNPLPDCNHVNTLSTPGTLQVVEGCNGWIGQDLLGVLTPDARLALWPSGWTVSFTALRTADYDFKGVSSCLSNTPISFGKDSSGAGICIGTLQASFSNNTTVKLEVGKTYYLGTPPDRVKNGGVEMFMK